MCVTKEWDRGEEMALEVGQVVSLGNPPFLRFGLAWDATGDCAPDLDASAVAFDLNGNGGCGVHTHTHTVHTYIQLPY